MTDHEEKKRQDEITAAEKEIQSDIERHALAIERGNLEDQIILGGLVSTVEDIDLDHLFASVSEIAAELDAKLEKSPSYAQWGHILIEQSCSLVYQLLIVEKTDQQGDPAEWEALKQSLITHVFTVIEREAIVLPQDDETRLKVEKHKEEFLSGRQPESWDDLGQEIVEVLREHIDQQTGTTRKFLTWREVLSVLEKRCESFSDTCVDEIEYENEDEGNIFTKSGTKTSFKSFRNHRLTKYKKILRDEYSLLGITLK
ncbi:MAG: hypothetical protein JXK94_06080 [Deltaproteobacteria bacterium]|nr:hypothetical protein [Deltaproteobacteria bacterium]